MELKNNFKSDFKYYKLKCPPPSMSEVLDFSNIKDDSIARRRKAFNPGNCGRLNSLEEFSASLMKPPTEWHIHELREKPGLIFICNPFTTLGQRYWIYRCLKDYTCQPNHLNIDAHALLDRSHEWWDSCKSDDKDSKILRKKLRWATMGYHHNWDTKAYSEERKGPFPADLAALCAYVNNVIYGEEYFNAEAAIINFYHFDSTLSGHTDHSEVDLTAPLFSFSFGQTAIFLLGGRSLDISATPMVIKSGDILIMSKECRQFYHGIPRIISEKESPWRDGQLLPVHCNKLATRAEENAPNVQCQHSKMDQEAYKGSEAEFCSPTSEGTCLILSLSDEVFWKPFEEYIQESRINMNVRQVLQKGQTSLTVMKVPDST